MGYTVCYGNHSFGKFTLGGCGASAKGVCKSFEMFGNSMTFPRWTCVLTLVGTCKQICFARTESKDPQDPSRVVLSLTEAQVSLTDGDANYMGSREGIEIHEITKTQRRTGRDLS